MTENTVREGRTYAFISYLTLIGTLIAFFMNQEKRNAFTSFHVRQSLGLWLLYLMLGYVVSGFDSWMISSSFWIFFSIVFLYGIFGAITGKENKTPIIGDFFQRIFSTIGQ